MAVLFIGGMDYPIFRVLRPLAPEGAPILLSKAICLQSRIPALYLSYETSSLVQCQEPTAMETDSANSQRQYDRSSIGPCHVPGLLDSASTLAND